MSTPWAGRLEAVGKAQERYLWFLLFAGVFYAALTGQQAATDTIPVPFVEIELASNIVWATGPAVISFIVLVIHGSLRAAKTAEVELEGAHGDTPFEAFDSAPNAIDLAVYTTPTTPNWIQELAFFSYPLFLTVFVVEAALLLWGFWADLPAGLWWCALLAGSTMLWLGAGGTTVWLFGVRFRKLASSRRNSA